MKVSNPIKTKDKRKNFRLQDQRAGKGKICSPNFVELLMLNVGIKFLGKDIYL